MKKELLRVLTLKRYTGIFTDKDGLSNACIHGTVNNMVFAVSNASLHSRGCKDIEYCQKENRSKKWRSPRFLV
ncbi:hypothetical protein ES706_02474 [subsurface metagenome]